MQTSFTFFTHSASHPVPQQKGSVWQMVATQVDGLSHEATSLSPVVHGECAHPGAHFALVHSVATAAMHRVSHPPVQQ